MDAVLIERAQEHLSEYNQTTAGHDAIYHAAVFAVHVDELLRLIETLTICQVCGCRPTLIHETGKRLRYQPACGCADLELASGYVGRHESGTGRPA